ncbi:hypothetical protein D9M69_613740 [compost metagenome]
MRAGIPVYCMDDFGDRTGMKYIIVVEHGHPLATGKGERGIRSSSYMSILITEYHLHSGIRLGLLNNG